MIEFDKEKEGGMAFALTDGNTIWISKKDIKNITMEIMAEGSAKKQVYFFRRSDVDKEKAQLLYDILKTQKDMSPKLIEKYLQQISELLSKDDEYVGSSEKGEEVYVNLSEIK